MTERTESSISDLVVPLLPITDPLSTNQSDLATFQDIRARILQTITDLYSFTPWGYQINALQSLLEDKRNTILYTPTSAGKSLIAQVYPVLKPS